MYILLKALVDQFEWISRRFGQLASWVYPLLVFVVCINVILRYGFSLGFIEAEELQWHLYSIGFLSAMAWTYADDQHVRVDLFRHRFSKRRKAIIEFYGCLFMLLPFSAALTYYSLDFVWYSWTIKETSTNPSGLPARYIIKSFITICFSLLILQSIATLLKSYLAIRSTKKP